MKNNIIEKGILKIVGSIKYTENPRDLDIVLEIEKNTFEKLFMNVEDFDKEKETGLWSEKHYKWASMSINLGKILQKRLIKALKNYPLDFKITYK